MDHERELDPMEWVRSLYNRNRPSLTFSATTVEEAVKWQGEFRAALLDRLGKLPERAADLNARILDVRELVTVSDDGRQVRYRREALTFQSQPGLTVFGYFLTPLSNNGRLPVVICLPGHGRGVDDIVGIKEDGELRTRWDGYQRDFALQCVAHGFAALALEQLGFGHRRGEEARKQGSGASSCQPLAGSALLLGKTMILWRVFDVLCALDYLQTRPEIYPDRVAVMGISGGGTTSLYAAGLDQRIKASVISGYFNLFRDSIYILSHCIDNYVPGLLNIGEMPDVAALIAPRPLHIESGTQDPIFPVEATKEGFERLRSVYRIFGAEDRLSLHIFEGEHSFNGEGAFPFLKRWL